VNETFAAFGLLNWKPVVSALLLPPVPWLLLIVMGCRLRPRRRWTGSLVLAVALTGLWLSHCQAVGIALAQWISPATALSPAQVSDLKRTLVGRKPVVLVLGGGTEALAPEYNDADLTDTAMQRLRYGLWLARQVQAPVMVSGGVGHGQPGSPSEAAVAARIALRDHNVSLRWQESESRDTRENARFSLLMLRADGVTDILLVTNGWHMRRAVRAFQQEAGRLGQTARIVPAPMGLGVDLMQPVQRWMPSVDGYRRVNQALHEALGLLAGA
jgi:uncharacterized SAM-binding protein YcdF (DUF218 family)